MTNTRGPPLGVLPPYFPPLYRFDIPASNFATCFQDCDANILSFRSRVFNFLIFLVGLPPRPAVDFTSEFVYLP